MTVDDAIKNRWSPRAFDGQELADSLIEELFTAAGSAPSAFNEQPWRYIIGKTGEENFEKILSCLVPFNQDWAKTSSLLALGVASKFFKRNGKENKYALHDLGAASSYLTLKAMEKDLFVHQMAGFDADKAQEMFNISKEFLPVTVIAIGKKGDPNVLPEEMRAKENERSPRMNTSSFVFTKNFEQDSN